MLLVLIVYEKIKEIVSFRNESTADESCLSECTSIAVNVSFVLLAVVVVVSLMLGIVDSLNKSSNQRQGQNAGQGQDVLSECTCTETGDIKCEKHDIKLLKSLMSIFTMITTYTV